MPKSCTVPFLGRMLRQVMQSALYFGVLMQYYCTTSLMGCSKQSKYRLPSSARLWTTLFKLRETKFHGLNEFDNVIRLVRRVAFVLVAQRNSQICVAYLRNRFEGPCSFAIAYIFLAAV